MSTTFQTIPLQPLPNQTVNVTLGGQQVTLNLYTRNGAVYIDVISNGASICYGWLCLNGDPIADRQYLGFVGILKFWDTQSTTDPVYSGLGTQYQLCYYPP